MFRRFFQQALVLWLAGTGLAGPPGAGTDGAMALTTARSRREIEENTAAELQYGVTRWTVENGLPQNSVRALAQTHDGYLWLGTLKGLARFDGVRFKVFDHSNTPEITHDAINGLTLDLKDGGLWIGTGDNLLYYRDHEFEQYALNEGVMGAVSQFCPAREGGVWFSSHPGQVSWAHGGKVQTWVFGPDDKTNAVHQLGEENAAELLLLVGKNSKNAILHRFNWQRKTLVPLQVPEGTTSRAALCTSFRQDADGSLWLCTSQGIWHGREGLWTQLTDADAQSNVWPQRTYQTRAGEVWVTQFDGNHVSLQRLVEGRLQPPSVLDWPTELTVTRVLEDREGDLWVGTTTGLLRLAPKQIRVYSRRDGLPSDTTQAVTKAADGTIWVGTSEGVGRIREGKVENIPPPVAGENWKNIGVFLADQQSALWVGHVDNWLARFQQETWQTFLGPGTIGNTKLIKALAEDRAGRMWIGTGNIVLCNQGGHWSQYTTNNGLSHPDVRIIYQDRRSDMWFGTFGGGLNRLNDGKFMSYKTGRGERNNRMWWIHEDAEGVFWVATEDGLNRFVPPDKMGSGRAKGESGRKANHNTSAAAVAAERHFFTFTTKQGLGENVVNNIQEDEFGYLWLSGLRGIYRISKHELNEVAAGRRAQVQSVAYGEADGMLNSECNGGDNQPAGCKDDQGRIWFPTVQGVVVIDPKAMLRTELPPPVVIEQVLANDQVVFGDGARMESEVRGHKSKVGAGGGPNAQSSYRLAPGHARVLEIHYTANTLAAPERVRFKYRLEGHDRDWLWDDQNRRVAFYTNLRPGDYTFQVTACNAHGTWSEQGDQFSFNVAPHLYETWPFYFLSGITAVGLAAVVQAYRLRWQRRLLKLEEQSAIANERTRIARDLHDDLGTALTGLALELDVVGRAASGSPPVAEHLGATARRTRDLAERMREVVWTVNPQCDTVSSLASFLEQQISQFLRATEVRVRLDFPDDIPALPLAAEARHNLALGVREALTNVVRHAHATEVVVSLAIVRQTLVVQITDNGRGFQSPEQSGHGLENMRLRLKQIGGDFKCISAPGEGTRVELSLPLKAPVPGKAFAG